MVLGYSTSTSFLQVDDWSTDPRVLGRHKMYQNSQHFVFVKNLWVLT